MFLSSSSLAQMVPPTSHQVIQLSANPGMTFKQANRKRPLLNTYTPQSSLPTVYTSVTFLSRRKGNMQASCRHITGALPSSDVQPQPEVSFQDFNDNFVGDDIDFGYMDDVATTASKRRRTAAVSIC